MSENKYRTQSYMVTYTCDSCEKGTLVPTGVSLMSSPPKYVHACGVCKAEVYLAHRYPRYVQEVINE